MTMGFLPLWLCPVLPDLGGNPEDWVFRDEALMTSE